MTHMASMTSIRYEICKKFTQSYYYPNLDSCLISYINMVSTPMSSDTCCDLPCIKVSLLDYFGPGTLFVKYTGFFENNKLLFYHGDVQDYQVGSILSLLCEFQTIPSKDLCICYERFMSRFETKVSGIQLKTQPVLPAKKQHVTSAKNQPVLPSDAIESLLSSNIELVEKLSKPPAERLPDFLILDEAEELKKIEDSKKRSDYLRKKEMDDINLRNKIVEDKHSYKTFKNQDSVHYETVSGPCDNDSDTYNNANNDTDMENSNLNKMLGKYRKVSKLANDDLKKQEQLIEHDTMRMRDIECELRDIDNQKRLRDEKNIENKNIFRSSKRSYVKINNDINDPAKKYSTIDNISPIFEAKYWVIRFMEDRELLDMNNAFNDNIEIDEIEYTIYEMLLDALSQVNNGLEVSDSDSDNSDSNSNDTDSSNDSDSSNDTDMSPLIPDHYDDAVKNDLKNIFIEFVEYITKHYESSKYSIRSERDIMNELNETDTQTSKIFKQTIVDPEDTSDTKSDQ